MTDAMVFEITKEGRKHTGISSAVCDRRTLEASACTAAWLENAVHTKGAIKNRAEKMIWPSEYRSMADAWELSGEEGRDKLR